MKIDDNGAGGKREREGNELDDDDDDDDLITPILIYLGGKFPLVYYYKLKTAISKLCAAAIFVIPKQ